MKAIAATWFLIATCFAQNIHAEDLDVDAARLAYERQQRVAQQAERQYEQTRQVFENAKGDLARAKQEERQARQQLGREKQKLTAMDTNIADLRSQIRKLESDLRRDRDELRFVKSQLPRLRSQLQDLKDQEDRIQKRIRRLSQRIAELEKKDPKPPELKRLKRERKQARTRLSRVQNEKRDASRQLQAARSKKQRLEVAIRDCENQLSSAQSRLANVQRARVRQKQIVEDARDRVQDKASDVGFAQGRVDSLRPSFQAALATMRAEKQRARELYDYYQEVVANYNQALNQVYAQAEAAASQHSQSEAANRAPAPARKAAQRDAKTEGERKGIADRAQRDEALGYEQGRQVGATAGDVKSQYKDGVSEGKNRAVQKAKVESFPQGYNDALAQLLGQAPAGSQVVDLQQGFPADPGVSGSYVDSTEQNVGFEAPPAFTGPTEPSYAPPTAQSPSMVVPAPNFSQSAPPCSNLPLAEFESLCRERYRSTYQSRFVRNYERQYASTYRQVFTQNVKGVYEATLAVKDTQSLRAGKENGARDQGVLDGFAGRIAAAQKQLYRQGQQALTSRLATGYLLVYRSGRLVDANGDGVMAPGEKVFLEVVVDNYGQQPSPYQQLKVTLKNSSGLANPSVTSQSLPALEGQTRTTLKGVLDSTVDTQVAGEKFSLSAVLTLETGGDTVRLGEVELGETTHFPLELTDISFPTTPKVNEEIEAELTFTNKANRGFIGGELELSTLPKMVEVNEEAPIELDKLDVGDSVTVGVKMEPGVWVGENTAVNFMAQITDADGEVITQRFPKIVPVSRNASVRLFNTQMKPETDATFEAKAGGYVSFYAQFTYHAKSSLPGPFEIRAAKTSDPGLALISNSTVAVNYGSFWPERRADPIRFTYRVPRSLKGKRGWIMITAKEGGQTLHAQMVYVDVN